MDGEAGWWTTSGNSGLPPLARVKGVGRQQQQQKADTLNKHYHQVLIKEDDTDTPTLEPRDVEDTLTTIAIQKDEVLKKLKSLKISSAAGPDNIHPRILKETQLEIAVPLKHMFQLSINEATLPRDWKDGNITQYSRRAAVRIQLTIGLLV